MHRQTDEVQKKIEKPAKKPGLLQRYFALLQECAEEICGMHVCLLVFIIYVFTVLGIRLLWGVDSTACKMFIAVGALTILSLVAFFCISCIITVFLYLKKLWSAK